MRNVLRGGIAAASLGLFMLTSIGAAMADNAPEGGSGAAFDAAPFGYAIHEADGKVHGVRWAQPRKVRRLVVEFPADAALPAAEKVGVQYWHNSWDGRPDPILAETAAGGEGWVAMDDWSNGKWKDADTRVQVDGRRWTITFAPTGEKEFKDLGNKPGVAYRKTLKIRLAADEPLPKPARLAAFTDSVCKPVKVRILFGTPAEPAIKLDGTETGHLEAFNGSITTVRAIAGLGATVKDDKKWALPTGAKSGIEADLVMAVDPVSQRYDHTVITVRSSHRPFSFAADEIARGDRILVDDLGVLVVRGDDTMGLEEYRQARKEFPGRTIYDRVFDGGEQTLTRAWNDMPIKHQLWFVHGLPGNRNAMKQEPNGDIGISNVAHWFARPHVRSPKDSDRKGWDGDYLWVRLGMPDSERRAGRELRDGYLPVLRTWWADGPIYYEQITVLDKLDGNLADVRLDDPSVLLMRIRVLNISAAQSGTAQLTFSTHANNDEKLRIENGRAVAQVGDESRFRFLINTGDKGELAKAGKTVKWSLDLKPGQSHTLQFAIPSITLKDDSEIEALGKRDFDADVSRICEFWKKLTDEGTQIDTPEPWLNDFYKAHARHLQVNCLKDLETSRRYAHVGTFHYGVYCNESAMMISDLDRRGYHKDAEECLQTWLDFQGTVKLNGNFKTKDGILYGANGAEAGSYNKHHGYAMWCLAEHWWYTRDRNWMEKAAPGLIKACDWIARERQATMFNYDDGTRAFEYGLLPAGGLEDVQDYWYWTATNACAAWGFDSVAAALADYGHPDAARIQKEAKAFHDDVVRAITDARVRAPVVKLRDGTYIPKFASEVYTRGRSIGWIREVLEGSVCLLLTGMVQPDTPEARWIVKDYEDNLYISDHYGYSIPTFDRFWFSRGGFCMQANLLDSPIPYILRDEVKHYLRTYFNSFCSGFFPEIRMLNEHALPELGYPAGDHFKSSDEAQSTYWLRLMFVHEQGNDLYLGQAIPRNWLADGRSVGIERAASHFGPLALRITSNANKGEVTAKVAPPTQTRPQNIYVRIRHPNRKPIQSVTVNGKPYDKFDVKKEWIILPGTVEGDQEIVAKY
jgi:hypothetical protein